MSTNVKLFAGIARDVAVEIYTHATLTGFEGDDISDPGKENDDPKKRPEVEPERLPKEDPGEPKKKPGEDDDDDGYTPYEEPEIGDDPEQERIKLPIM
jgi:hypothetical protein